MSIISAGTTSGTALVTSGDTTGQLVFQTNGTTTALTIGTNQVVTFAAAPVISGGIDIVTTTGTQTLTNKTLAFGSNTFTGALGVANGGTGASTLTANAVLIGNGTSAVTAVAPGASGNLLVSNGTTWASTAPTAPTTKVWSAYTSTTTYTVPAGVTSIRVYAFGAGGSVGLEYDFGMNWQYSAAGAGGGCAFGDLAVTPGTTVTITISSGNATVSYAAVTRFTANKGANGTTPLSAPNAAAGGSASIGTGVTNGNAFTGGAASTGGIFGGTGGASASPLGVGNAGRFSNEGGPGWGTATGGDPYNGNFRSPGPSGGAGGAANLNLTLRAGIGRGGHTVYTDPLLASLVSPGVTGFIASDGSVIGDTAGPGAGGGGGGTTGTSAGEFTIGGDGGFGGGGGGIQFTSATRAQTGAGGFGAAAGAGRGTNLFGSPAIVVGASGFGAGASTGVNGSFGSGNTPSIISGTAGAAIVLIYA